MSHRETQQNPQQVLKSTYWMPAFSTSVRQDGERGGDSRTGWQGYTHSLSLLLPLRCSARLESHSPHLSYLAVLHGPSADWLILFRDPSMLWEGLQPSPRFTVGKEAWLNFVPVVQCSQVPASGRSPHTAVSLCQKGWLQGSAPISRVKGPNTIGWISCVLFKSFPLLVDGPEYSCFPRTVCPLQSKAVAL